MALPAGARCWALPADGRAVHACPSARAAPEAANVGGHLCRDHGRARRGARPLGDGVLSSCVSVRPIFFGGTSEGAAASARRRTLVQCSEASSSSSAGLREGNSELFSTNSFTDGRWEAILSRLELVCKSSPETSLIEGRWVKLICGASFEDIADVRNLSLIYALAGVDCIDCAADSAIVAAVLEGINAAEQVLQTIGSGIARSFKKPWVMISINDDEDPHFRKAEFDSLECPTNCPRPCERVCPASAIKFQDSNQKASSNHLDGGVIVDRCYGCGRCLPICPLGLISAISYVRPLETVASLLRSEDVDAVEIHTRAGHLSSFRELVSQLGNAFSSLKLVAVSVPDLEELMIPTLNAMYTSMKPFVKNLNLWQLDGRPMSGDIGVGATRAAIMLAQKVVSSSERPPGFIQLAGGTNAHTATALKNVGLQRCITYENHGVSQQYEDNQSGSAVIAGVAYGGYARKIVDKFLRHVGEEETCGDVLVNRSSNQMEHYPHFLLHAVLEANVLVDSIKCSVNQNYPISTVPESHEHI
ncbi:hypothetical protein MPTK1_3g01080 [Marchantia polymorpha subsp. ruderalis]|uniref:4Fe-4S ferredoxin-type domain-containing protein n=2 Tax=Marchantia polymorpha TaxID=3197 RepID=A0AAF6AW68_MARPO|nr:hypothetical protein MARPO_0007s0102 [Marchantia polymorpha]BBN04002.1 hypothetical protein Mp_3g01080 [Marchantia polymorpha subsp. ruderalis]|eukprot:PTQ47691.1 hypothetical protein MARPO_0007s0102 [Marchantia polymorpha]